MKWMTKRLSRFVADERGGVAVEYAVLLALSIASAAAAVVTFAPKITAAWAAVESAL